MSETRTSIKLPFSPEDVKAGRVDVVEWFDRAKDLGKNRPAVAVTRRLTFSAGHRVYGHESKCANPHGHNYVVNIKAAAVALDGVGRVIDFGVIKTLVGGWLDANWDHGFLYFLGDPDMAALFMTDAGKRWHSFGCPFNPTAENIALYLLRDVLPDLFQGTGVTVVEVEIEETENCRAVARI